MKKTIAKKGYTLEVTSWENDGDNYQTKSHTFEDEATARKMAKMCKELFCSCNNGEGGIGNMMEGDEEDMEQIILDYLEENEVFINQSTFSNSQLVEKVEDMKSKLMGSSDWYLCRVFDSCKLFYSPEEVVLDLIEIKI